MSRNKKKTSAEGPSTKHDVFMRVCMDKNEENQKFNSGTIHKIRLFYASLYEQKRKKKDTYYLRDQLQNTTTVGNIKQTM